MSTSRATKYMEVVDIRGSSSKRIIGCLPIPFHYDGSVLSVASSVDSLSPKLFREFALFNIVLVASIRVMFILSATPFCSGVQRDEKF
ncbi:hypothetical protein Tco_0072958 [Tanacetum coccineum]